MNKPTRKVKPYPQTPPDLPIETPEDEYPVQRLNAIDYIVITFVVVMFGWLVWEAMT